MTDVSDDVYHAISNVECLPGYSNAVRRFYSLALESAGDTARGRYPLWGTCLGFEMLARMSAGDLDVLANCQAENQPANLRIV